MKFAHLLSIFPNLSLFILFSPRDRWYPFLEHSFHLVSNFRFTFNLLFDSAGATKTKKCAHPTFLLPEKLKINF